MFKKSIDSILKRANKIVTDLKEVSDQCSLALDEGYQKLEDIELKQSLLLDEKRKADTLAKKWSELV